MRKEYVLYVEEYMNRLEPFMSRLQQEKKIEILERREMANYCFDKEGLLFKIEVKEWQFN